MLVLLVLQPEMPTRDLLLPYADIKRVVVVVVVVDRRRRRRRRESGASSCISSRQIDDSIYIADFFVDLLRRRIDILVDGQTILVH